MSSLIPEHLLNFYKQFRANVMLQTQMHQPYLSHFQETFQSTPTQEIQPTKPSNYLSCISNWWKVYFCNHIMKYDSTSPASNRPGQLICANFHFAGSHEKCYHPPQVVWILANTTFQEFLLTDLSLEHIWNALLSCLELNQQV